jgi:hypothetical protein
MPRFVFNVNDREEALPEVTEILIIAVHAFVLWQDDPRSIAYSCTSPYECQGWPLKR